MWGWFRIRFVGDREYGSKADENGATELYLSINLRTIYLPSQTLRCEVTAAGVAFGGIAYPQGISYNVQHSNPECNGHPTIQWFSRPTHTYYVTAEMYATDGEMANGAYVAGSYWTDVGTSLQYPGLSTVIGGESAVYPHPVPQPDFMGQWDPATDQIWLNNTHYGGGLLTGPQWTWITAHELGHAIGFGHVPGGDTTRTIMPLGATPPHGLPPPRVLDQCGAVKAYPVNIHIG